MHITSLRSSVQNAEYAAILQDNDVHEIFMNFAFNAVGSSVNAHRFVKPASSPLYDRANTKTVPCTEDCYEGCRCTNIIKIPANKTIQMVFSSFTTVNDLGKFHDFVSESGPELALIEESQVYDNGEIKELCQMM